MKKQPNLRLLLTALSVLVFFPLQAQIGEMEFPEGSVQHVVLAGEIQWMPCPPNLPAGCRMAVLEGSPKNNDLFTVRFRVDDGMLMPPHTHPKDERVTILKGTAAVAFGENVTRKDAREFGPGDYYVNSRGAVHSVWLDPGTELQITGIGPWEVDYVEQE
jgi:quercetin dioxygenase-like cupin family protein